MSAVSNTAPDEVFVVRILEIGKSQLVPDLFRRDRDDRLCHQRDKAHAFTEMIENSIEKRCLGLILSQCPWHGHIDIFIERTDKGPYRFQCIIDLPAIHACAECRKRLSCFVFDFLRSSCHRLIRKSIALGQDAISVFFHHGKRAVQEIPEIIRQVGIDTSDQSVAAEIAVLPKLDIIQKVVADRIRAKFLQKRDRIYDIALGLGHFLSVYDEPAVAIDHLRQLDAKAHQHDRPDDGMETNDLLAHQMHVCRPELLEFFRIVDDARRGQVVDQCIKPDIHDMLGVKRYLDAPGKARAGDAEVFQPALDELDHFIAAGFRLNEARILFHIFHPAIRILGHFEEIRFFTDSLQRTAAVRTGVILIQLIFRPEGFAWHAVPAFILALVNIALIIGALEEHLHDLFMTFLGGADEVIIGNIELLPQLLEHAYDLIRVLDRRDTGFLCLLLDLLSVLIRSGQEKDIIAVKTLETSHAVSDGCAVCMPDVQLRAGIVNRRGDIVFRFVVHSDSSCLYWSNESISFCMHI